MTTPETMNSRSPLCAFHADADVRSQALRRLAGHVENKTLHPGPLAWDGEKGSVVGCLIESQELAVWQQRLGLAPWLAHALDAVTVRMGPARALEAASALLDAVPPGADTGPAGSALMAGLLEAIAAAQDVPAPLQAPLDAIIALHRRSAAGESLAPAGWKAVRRQALAATDGFDAQDRPREHAIGAAIESAAWDPQRSVLAVAELQRQWQALEGLRADADFGWTAEDDAHIRRRLGQMHATYIEPNPAETRDVFKLLEEHHAEEAARLRAYIRFGREYGLRCAERAAELMVRLLPATLSETLER